VSHVKGDYKMRKFTKFIAIATLLFASVIAAVPAESAWRDMWAYVYRWTGQVDGEGRMKLTRITSGVTFSVLATDSATYETLYYYNNDAFTSLTNPVTTTSFASNTICNDRVAFRVDPTDAGDEQVDLIVTDTAGGYTVIIEDFTKNDHSIIIDERPNILHHGCVPFTAATTETDTGVDFEYGAIITDVRVEVVTADVGQSMDVGLLSSETAGAVNGFLTEVPLTNTGFRYDSTGIYTRSGSHDQYGASMYGKFLVQTLAGGGGTYETQNLPGGRFFYGHHVEGSNAKSLTYTATAVGAVGRIHYWFMKIANR